MHQEVFIRAIPEIVTQLVGFLIVFLILKKYAFGTLLRLIDERRRVIERDLKDAETRRAEAERLEAEYQAKLRLIEQEARAKILEAVGEANRVSREIREDARQEALKIIESSKADIANEVAKSRTLIRNEMVELSLRAAGRLIRKNLTDADNRELAKQALGEAEKS